MARVFANRIFEQYNVNISKLPSFQAGLLDDEFLTFNGITYSDVYSVNWFLGGGGYYSLFVGNEITADFVSITGGTIQAYYEVDYSEGQPLPILGIYDIEYSASEFYSAFFTDSAVDNFELFMAVFSGDDFFDLSPFNDVAYGMGGDDTFFGNSGADSIVGEAGNDSINGGSGNDFLNGGSGVDTALYSGSQGFYTLALSPNATTLEDRRTDGNGTDTLVSIENLQFLDGTFDIGIRSGATGLSAEDFAAIAELYIAYFDRAPASKGLLYWGTRLDDGMTLPEIANSFFVQPETQRTYEAFLNDDGSLNDTEAFVTAVFNNVLGRDPNGPYWVNELDNNPGITPAIFILAVLNGAKAETGGAADRAYLSNKTDIGVYFSAIKGLSDYDDTVSVMNIFDGSAASVNAAVSAIDQIHADALDPINGEFLMPLVGVIDDPFAIA
jgi:hypothetical protein